MNTYDIKRKASLRGSKEILEFDLSSVRMSRVNAKGNRKRVEIRIELLKA